LSTHFLCAVGTTCKEITHISGLFFAANLSQTNQSLEKQIKGNRNERTQRIYLY
jgi:hypothetical protein